MKRLYIYTAVLGIAMASLTLMSCSDTWDDHYDVKHGYNDSGSNLNTLWDAISSNSELSNFANVIKACGFDKSLGGNQVFTVFAPTNNCFSAEEANALIAAYNKEKDSENVEGNISTFKEFIHNHVALYNHSVSSKSNDSIVMMNGKYLRLTPTQIGDAHIAKSNQLYDNGVLFIVNDQVKFFPNLFEYIKKDPDLDSLRQFMYDKRFFRYEFSAGSSVIGGIEDGKTVYLDSVFYLQNDLFEYNFLKAYLNDEDSTYLMVAPTNEVWRNKLEEYTTFFNYDNKVQFRDSLVYTNPRLAIMKGTIFSRTFNSDAALQDSAMSTNCVLRYNSRRGEWGADTLHYYEYYKPYDANGIFNGTTTIPCSNGTMMKANVWNFPKNETVLKNIIMESEYYGTIQEIVSKYTASTGELESVVPQRRTVSSDNPFYGQVSNNTFIEFEPRANKNHEVRFNITDVLSNVGYDIYLVTAPAQAYYPDASEYQRLPCKLGCSIYYHDQEGNEVKQELVSEVETKPDIVDHILLAENFKFPTCSYGLYEEKPQISLFVETKVKNADIKRNTHNRTMLIDCIILKPHQD